MTTLIFPLDVACGRCQGATTEITVGLPSDGPAMLTGGQVRVSVEARCPACGNHVIFGAVPARIE